MKLKGRHFETMSDNQRYSWYSTTVGKMISMVLLKRGKKNDRIAVHFPKGIVLEDMAAKIE
jgi:hypothetical protein